jgi:hypothetical protein
MRTFTLQEAQTLLPLVESLLKRAQEAVRVATERENDLQQLSHAIYISGGMRVDVVRATRLRSEHEKAVAEARDTLSEIDAIGVQIKDLEKGLLDFPFQLDDQIVLLCWLQGETTITYWHSLDAGFAGRQPVDHRFHRIDRTQ